MSPMLSGRAGRCVTDLRTVTFVKRLIWGVLPIKELERKWRDQEACRCGGRETCAHRQPLVAGITNESQRVGCL
jgi:hypothetical protein